MVLQRLLLTHFRSYEEQLFDFSEVVNCVVGENGSGKTNLLDAIYYLSLTKSAFTNQDANVINHEADFMMIEGKFEETLISCSLQRGQKKVFLTNKKPYERLADHIGRYPVVLIAPNDTDVVREGSEERRKFFDGVLSQLESEYLLDLLHYNRLLDQRNGLLKQFAERGYLDEVLLDIYTEPLIEYALKLYAWRSGFLVKFLPVFKKHYAHLSESREAVEVIYESELATDDFRADFKRNRQRDVAAQRTTVGPHRDDYVFEINQFLLKKFGSQGQQKAFMIALKLAQFELIATEKQRKPLLLLDDIFDKLDDRRIQKLLGMMTDGTFGQVFVTDARPERTRQLFEEKGIEVKFFEVKR